MPSKRNSKSERALRRSARARAHARGLTSRRDVARFVKRSLAAVKGWATRRERGLVEEDVSFEFGGSQMAATPKERPIVEAPIYEDDDSIIVEDPIVPTP